jgi:hypothetical protein
MLVFSTPVNLQSTDSLKGGHIALDYNLAWLRANGGGGGIWGSIGGTLASQTDLSTALGLKANLAAPVFTGQPTIPDFTLATHSHLNAAGGGTLDAAAIVSGAFGVARLPLLGASGGGHQAGVAPDPGASGGTTKFLREDATWVAISGSNATQLQSRTLASTAPTDTQILAWSTGANQWQRTAAGEPVITAGTTAQYWRGDKSWQTLTAALPTTTPVAHQFVVSSAAGVLTLGQPAAADAMPTAPATPGIVALYDFVQGASPTTLYDRSGNGNNGTLRTAALPTWANGGLTFTSTQIVDLPTISLSPKTVITAVAPASFTGTQIVWGTSGDWDGILSNHWNSSVSYASGAPYTSGDASNPVIYTSVRGATAMTTYSNGAFNLSTPQTQFPAVVAMASLNNLSFPFTGSIYYQVVFNRALTDAEVLQWTEYIQQVLAFRGVVFPPRATVGPIISRAFGDSITGNFGCSITANCYVPLIQAAQGATITNNGVAGQQITTLIDTIYGITVPGTANYVALLGYNDMRNYGTSAPGQLTFSDTLTDALAWLAIPDAAKIRGQAGSGITYTGTWINSAYGGLSKSTVTSGGTAAFSLTGSTLYIDYTKLAGTAGTFTVAVDGAVVGTVNANAGATDGNGRTYSTGRLRVTGLTNTTHAVVLTQLTGTLYFNWAAGLPLTTPKPPAVYVGNVLHMTTAGYALGTGTNDQNGSDAAVVQFNAIIASVTAQLVADGLNLIPVDTSNVMNPLTSGTSDNIHPGDPGHAELANAFLAAINLLPVAAPLPVTLPPTGSAGGSLGCTFPNPCVGDVTELWTVGAGGVLANTLVKMDTTTGGQVVALLTSDVAAFGAAQATAVAGGTVKVTRFGKTQIVLDSGTATIGNAAIPSTTTGGDMHDSGLSRNAVSSLTGVSVFRTACASACAGTTVTIEFTGSERGALVPVTQVSGLSVALTTPSWFTVSGSPVTGAGTIAVTAASAQTSHQVIGTCGSATAFSPCSLVAADLPTTAIAQKFFVTAAPGSIATNLPGDLATDTTNHHEYVCNAPSGTATPACTSVATAGWLQVDGGSTTVVHQYGGGFGTPGGAALVTGGIIYTTIPQACTINSTNILVDAGTATVKYWKIATGAAIPTVANVINTSGISIASGTAAHSATVTDFTTTAIAAHDILAMTLTAVSGAGFVQATLECQ